MKKESCKGRKIRMVYKKLYENVSYEVILQEDLSKEIFKTLNMIF